MKIMFTFIICATILLVGCNTIKRNNHMILIDFSKTIHDLTFTQYINTITGTIIPNLGQCDRITVLIIDECSMIKSERIYNIDLAKKDFTNPLDGLNYTQDSIKARIRRFSLDSIQVILKKTILEKREDRKSCSDYTDIVNALNELEPLLDYTKSYSSDIGQIINDAKGDDNYEYINNIYIFSDMINEDREGKLNFNNIAKCDEKEIENLLEEVKMTGKVPDLTNCNIFVHGATALSSAGSLANKQIENVRYFWKLFFNEAGATLRAYAYDTEIEIKEFLTQVNY